METEKTENDSIEILENENSEKTEHYDKTEKRKYSESVSDLRLHNFGYTHDEMCEFFELRCMNIILSLNYLERMKRIFPHCGIGRVTHEEYIAKINELYNYSKTCLEEAIQYLRGAQYDLQEWYFQDIITYYRDRLE